MGRGTNSKTLADLLPLAAQKYGDAPAVRYKDGDDWVDRSFAEVREIVRPLALGLPELGIEKGDRVSILGNTRPEWTYFDFAALSIGATVVPIYQTNSPEECRYVLENSDAKVVVVEDDEQLEKVREVREQLPTLEHVVRMTGTSEDAISTAELSARRGAGSTPAAWQQRYRSVTPAGRLHLHLHLRHHRPAEGLHHQPRQLPVDARHGQRDQRRSKAKTSPTSTSRSPTPSPC